MKKKPLRPLVDWILRKPIVGFLNVSMTIIVLSGLIMLSAITRAEAATVRCESVFALSTYDKIMNVKRFSDESIAPLIDGPKSVDMAAAAIVDRQTKVFYKGKEEAAELDAGWAGDKSWVNMSRSYMKFDPKKADIIIFFPIEHSPSILKKGFLNQHQTGKSMGGLDLKLRTEVEDKVAQLKLGSSALSAKVRPKFGIVNFREDLPFDGAPSYAYHEARQKLPPRDNYYVFKDISKTYGGVAAVLKSKVKRQATFTSDDTLSSRGATAPQDIVTFQSEYMKDTPSGRYYEAQIYGNLRSKDIDYFLIKDVTLAENLKIFGRPIYEVKEVMIGYRVVFEKGTRLF